MKELKAEQLGHLQLIGGLDERIKELEAELAKHKQYDLTAAVLTKDMELSEQLTRERKVTQVLEKVLWTIANEHSHYIGALERNLEVKHPFHGVMSKMGDWAREALAEAAKAREGLLDNEAHEQALAEAYKGEDWGSND